MESRLILAALAMAVLALLARAAFAGRAPWEPRIQDDMALAQALQTIARKHAQPAMAAALVRGERIVARAAVGSTVEGGEGRVGLESRFHIGSTTKGVTALVVAILVREGRLRYDTPLDAVFEDLPMRDEYRKVTVRDLLVHRAGLMALQLEAQEDPEVMKRLWSELPRAAEDPREQRRRMAELVLGLPAIAPPGTRHVYSNVGYAILGHVAETAADESFESLLASRVFRPLGMTTAKVGGWPASEAEPDQPRGHYSEDGKLRPQSLADAYVFPDWMNPSGGIHCSVEDYARYARETLRGLQGKGALLDQAGYAEMHRVQAEVRLDEMYAPSLPALRAAYGSKLGRQKLALGYGWLSVPSRRGAMSACDGSGGTFFARVVVAPGLDAAFVAMTSTGAGAAPIAEAVRAVTGLAWD